MNTVAYIKEGDLRTFNDVFSAYHRKLYFYILKKTNSSFLAEEIVQTSFIKLWQFRKSLNEALPLEVQLYRIAKTSLIDHFRKKVLSELAEIDRQTFNEGVRNLEEADLKAQLSLQLDKMPRVQRKVFLLSRHQGLTHKQIATKLKISVKTVESHIRQALKHLRHVFPEYCLIIFTFFCFH